jgi:hypothetical protein
MSGPPQMKRIPRCQPKRAVPAPARPYDLPAELKSQTLKRMKPASDASESVK